MIWLCLIQDKLFTQDFPELSFIIIIIIIVQVTDYIAAKNNAKTKIGTFYILLVSTKIVDMYMNVGCFSVRPRFVL